ncbi:hypothetical protein P8452_59319 [Trifolium repens]|nr:hypothetical protein P8452_59319 [Trifolium repens]
MLPVWFNQLRLHHGGGSSACFCPSFRVSAAISPLPSAAFWCFAAVFDGFGLVVVTDLGFGMSRFGFLFYAAVMRFDFGCYRCFDGGG